MNANRSKSLLSVRNRAALAVLVLVPLVTTCGRQQQLRFDAAWSPSETFPTSGYARLAKLNGLPVCIDGNDYYFLRPNGTTWEKKTFSSAVEIPNAHPQTGSASPKFILHDGNAGFGNVRDGQFQARIACCSLDPITGVRTIFDRSFTLSRNDLVGTNATPTCDIPVPPAWRTLGPPRIVPEEGHLGGSLILGKDIYVAYSMRCGSLYGPNGVSGTGPNQASLLWGNADGSRWTKLKLLDIDSSFEEVFATSNNIYFLAAPGRGLEKGLRRGIRSVRLSRATNAQPTTEIVAPKVAMLGGYYAAVAEGDTTSLGLVGWQA